MLQRAARNAYSWWWASHVRTKQSKWLDQNLQDMEEKVEYILKIIDEDGDTFRQRAEMYYQKRPEIVNFVEDAFRGYRALAERYDHLSKELQSANRAIATVYPERVPFEMDENDDFDLDKFSSTMALQLSDPNMLSKTPPAAPKLNIPRNPSFPRKKSKAPTRLMSKKGLLKINAGDTAYLVPSSGLDKSEALQRIDKLQKEILSLQTEKEFARSSYESGLEKYWDIEKRITEMQGEVSALQDEFGIGMVIEDDEARTLMTSAAIKSCQETLARLQKKQEQAVEDARVEFQKVQEAREKIMRLKVKLTGNSADLQEHLEESEVLNPNLDRDNLKHQEGGGDQTIQNLEIQKIKLKEELKADLGDSLTISTLAEKVDEVVDKVINLESTVSCLSGYVKRLKSETDELQTHIQSLEEDKGTLIDGSRSMNNKIRELEEELERVQSLNQHIEQQNNHLQTRYIEASCNLDELSKKLLNVKPDEEDENTILSTQVTDALDVIPVKQIQLQEVATKKNVPEISKDRSTNEEQSTCKVGEPKNLAQTISNYLQNPKVAAISDTNREFGGPVMEVKITPDRTLVVSDGETVLEEVNREDSSNSTKNEPSKRTKSQLNFTSGDVKSEERFRENKDKIVRGDGSMAMQEQGKEQLNPFDEGLPQLSEQLNINDSRRISARATSECIPCGRERGDVLLSNHDNQPIKNPLEKDYSRSQRRHSGNDLGNIKGPTEPVLHDGLEGKSVENSHSTILAEHVKMKDESKKGEILGDSNVKSADENNSGWNGNLSEKTVINKNTGMEEDYGNLSLAKPDSIPGHPSMFNSPNDLPVIDQARNISGTNQQHEGFNRSVNAADPSNILTAPRDVEMVDTMKQNSIPDQGNDHEQRKQNVLLTAPGEVNTDENDLEEDDQPNWRELFLTGIDDREKILLQEYTSILRNYKDAKKKLNEVEKKKRASLFQYCIQIKVLRSSNSVKDAEIQSLQKKLNLFRENQDETPESKEREKTETKFHVSDDKSLSTTDQKGLEDLSVEATEESTTGFHQTNVSNVEEDEGIQVINIDESPKCSIIEEKIRSDIDDLLEENLDFWMRFSTSFQQIQKFQTTFKDLQAEIAKLKAKKEKGGITNQHSFGSDVRPIYRHLTEIQTELALWLDQNTMIKDDLENRLSSLSSIQEEITRFSNAGSNETEVTTELDDYQAAKFQGEVLNMKQENNKVANELQSGLERVKNLQDEIEKTLTELDDEFDVSLRSQQSRFTGARSRIPLRSFLFGVKLKKQKRNSFLACISPSLNKQNSHLTDFPL